MGRVDGLQAMSYGPYDGICYDGPYEGRRYKNNDYLFRVPIYSPPQPAYSYCDYDPDYTGIVRTCTYRWSAPLRKWVFHL